MVSVCVLSVLCCLVFSSHIDQINDSYVTINIFFALYIYMCFCSESVMWLRLIINTAKFQLIECPSIYELMACRNFHWEHIPLLEIWREKKAADGNSHIILESYQPEESVEIYKEALYSNTVSHELSYVEIVLLRFT